MAGMLGNLVPRMVFFTKGIGRDKTELQSFESALRDAGIEKYNLVTVSSIFPPHCKVLSREEGAAKMGPGQIVFCVMSRNASNEPERLLGASVGVAMPTDPGAYGYISEYHAFGQDEKTMSDAAEDMASSMLASTLGIDFDPNKDYDERRAIYLMSGKIVDSYSTTVVTRVQKEWTSVVAAAVFVLD